MSLNECVYLYNTRRTDNQCLWWRGGVLSVLKRLARKLISGSRSTAKKRLLSLNRTQFRFVTGPLIGHNTLRRYLHLMGLIDSPLCRRYGAEEEISVHVLCEFEALASLRHAYLGSFFLYTDDVKSLSLGVIWNFSKGTRLPWLDIRPWGTKNPSKGLGASGQKGLEPNHKSNLK
jgi:hypothetical protein